MPQWSFITPNLVNNVSYLACMYVFMETHIFLD